MATSFVWMSKNGVYARVVESSFNNVWSLQGWTKVSGPGVATPPPALVYAVGAPAAGQVPMYDAAHGYYVPQPPVAPGTYAPYGLAVGRGGACVPIGLHGKTNPQGISDGVSQSSTYRTFHQLTDAQAGSVLPVFTNWWGSADVATGNAITVACAVEASDGTVLPFTFGGAHTVTIPSGGYAVADGPVGFGLQLAATDATGGATLPLKGVWIRTYVSVSTGGQKWPVGIDPRLTSGEGNNGSNGADLTATGSGAVSGGSFSYAYGPALLLGKPHTRKPIVAVVGDSQIEGSNDSCLNRGYAERVCENLAFPMVKVAKGGESASNFAPVNGRKFRMTMIDGCTHALVNYGTNDLVNRTRTTTQVKADLLTIWTYLAGLGMKVYQATITPRTTSTDSWTTTGNQTATGTGGTSLPADLADVNSYIRAQVGQGVLTGVVEIGDAFSTSRDSGLWKSNTSSGTRDVSDDGTHMSRLGIVGIAVPTAQAVMTTWTV